MGFNSPKKLSSGEEQQSMQQKCRIRSYSWFRELLFLYTRGIVDLILILKWSVISLKLITKPGPHNVMKEVNVLEAAFIDSTPL